MQYTGYHFPSTECCDDGPSLFDNSANEDRQSTVETRNTTDEKQVFSFPISIWQSS